MEFRFPTYRISVDFSSLFPRPAQAWLPTSLFWVDDRHKFLLLRRGEVGAFWLLGEDFSLIDNDPLSMQGLLGRFLLPYAQPSPDRAFILEIQGLAAQCSGDHDTALNALLEACAIGELRDAESYSALVEASSRLGRLSETLPLVEAVLDKPDFFTPEQAAGPRAWLGRSCADRLDFARGHKLLAAAVAGFASPPGWLPLLLDDCARQDTTTAFGDPPEPLLREVMEFGQAALDFLAGRPCTWNAGCYPTITVARHWVRRSVRIIHIEPGDTETVAWLQANGISPAFLQAVVRGRDGVGEACFAACPDVPFAADPTISLRMKEVAATVLLGGKPVLCPFTGDRDLARDTINLHTFLHRKNGRSCIIFSDPDISIAPADSAWFFPDLGVLLTHGWNMRPEVDLATTMQRVLDNVHEVNSYLSTDERVVMVSEEGEGHIGHYIWNVISGWDQLFRLTKPKEIDIVTSYDGGHFFGGVTELYGNELRSVGRVIRVPRREDAYAAMLAHRGLSLILRNQYVTQDLAQRVQAWCQGHVSEAFLAARAEFRRLADPLLMITIRLDNRTWIEQETGFAELINSLAAEHPRLGVVIDGLNALPPGTQTFVPMSLANEQAVADRIIAACPGVRFVNSVGCTPAESVLWCTAIDVFAAPIGAGLAKSRWIANKPGVGFSNRTFLADGHFEGRLYSHFREQPSTMLYVGREHVSDVDGGHHGMIGRANFSMDWRAPLAKLRMLLPAPTEAVNWQTMAGFDSLSPASPIPCRSAANTPAPLPAP